MEILKTILELVFIVMPLIGGIGFLLRKALQIEKKRTAEYANTMLQIRLTCIDFRHWMLRSLRTEDEK